MGEKSKAWAGQFMLELTLVSSHASIDVFCIFKRNYEIIELLAITKKGKRSAQIIRNALILLNSDEGERGSKKKNSEIASILQIGERTIDRIKKLFVEEGFEQAVYGFNKNMARTQQLALNGDAEAHLISLCCSDPPEGFARWSLRLLADQMVTLGYVSNVSHETIRKTLKKRT